MIRRRRLAPRRSSRVRDVAHMLSVKALPCLLAEADPLGCGGPVEADHVGYRGLGQKSDDAETIPLCTRHHRARTDFSGYFAGFDRAAMRAFVAEGLAKTRAALGL